MAELQTEMTPQDGQISNDVAGSVRIGSAVGEIIVTDKKALNSLVDDIDAENFHGGQHLKVFKLGQKIPGLLSGITLGDNAPYYRIPSMVMTKRGRMIVVSDYRMNGADQVAIEIAYGISESGGLNMEYGRAVQRDTTTSGYVNSQSRVMDSTLLYDPDNGDDGTLYLLAGKWIAGAENWQNHQWSSGANTSKGKWTSAIMAKFDPSTKQWTQEELRLVNTDGATDNIHGLLGGVGQGIKCSNGEYIMPVQYTEAASGYKAGVIVTTNPNNGWTFIRNQLAMSEWSIFELRPGLLVGMGRMGGSTKAYQSTDWGRTWSVFNPFNEKITQSNGDCEGSYISFTTLAGKRVTIGTRPQNNDMADLGTSSNYGRNQITLYYLSEQASKAMPVDVLHYIPGVDNDGERNSTVYGGYSSLAYYQGIDGEKLFVAYEDRGGITIQDISYLISQLNQLSDKYDPSNEELEDQISTLATPVVKDLVGSEINYIGETTLGPVLVTEVCADLSSVNDEGALVDARSGIAYPKGNTGAVKPYMGTGEESGLIIYDGENSDGNKVYTRISNEEGVLGLSAPFTVAFEFNYSNNGEMTWPSVFRIYGSATGTGTSDWQSGCNIKREPATGSSRIVFNPFGAIFENNTTNATFVMNDSSCPGVEQGKTIHYVIVYLENGRQIHYVNGVEVNNTTAVNGSGLGGNSGNLPSPGDGFRPKNSSIVPKSIVICNDPASLKYFKIGFGNLKFYNRKLSGDEVLSLYKRRKEYLQALKTDYKSGFVGALNELKDDITSLNSFKLVKDKMEQVFEASGLYNTIYSNSTLPHKDNIILNMTPELFKSGDLLNGYRAVANSSVQTVKPLPLLRNGEALTSFGVAKESGFASTEYGVDLSDGTWFIGSDERLITIDLTTLGLLSGNDGSGFTIELVYSQPNGPAAAWTDIINFGAYSDLPAKGNAGGYNIYNASGKSFRIENKAMPSGGAWSISGYCYGTSSNRLSSEVLKEGITNGSEVKVVITMDSSNNLKFYVDYSQTDAMHGDTGLIENIKYVFFNLGNASGKADKAGDLKIHKLRIWKGVCFSDTEVASLGSI